MCKTHELVFSFCWNLYFYNLSWKQHTWVKQSVSIRRSLCGLVYEVSNETSNNFVVFYFPSSFRSFVRQKCSFATSYVRWERPNDELTFGRNIQFVTELNFADVFLEEQPSPRILGFFRARASFWASWDDRTRAVTCAQL